jgi:hypothetical protein
MNNSIKRNLAILIQLKIPIKKETADIVVDAIEDYLEGDNLAWQEMVSTTVEERAIAVCKSIKKLNQQIDLLHTWKERYVARAVIAKAINDNQWTDEDIIRTLKETIEE